MASVYILFSARLDRYYIGSCRNLHERLAEHGSKKYAGSYTAKTNDWVLHLSIDRLNYKEARGMEKYIKSMKSRIYIERLKSEPKYLERLKQKF